jgi:hypothetical protein
MNKYKLLILLYLICCLSALSQTNEMSVFDLALENGNDVTTYYSHGHKPVNLSFPSVGFSDVIAQLDYVNVCDTNQYWIGIMLTNVIYDSKYIGTIQVGTNFYHLSNLKKDVLVPFSSIINSNDVESLFKPTPRNIWDQLTLDCGTNGFRILDDDTILYTNNNGMPVLWIMSDDGDIGEENSTELINAMRKCGLIHIK